MSRQILLGVSGGIAAYKAPSVVREFTTDDHQVRVVLTESAREFVSPVSLEAVSEHRVESDLFEAERRGDIGHIELARWADAILLAPATANLLARIAGGFADDLLTTVLVASRAPVVVAPAMNTQMWAAQPVRDNVERLEKLDRYTVLPPDSGQLACRETGPGRMPDPPVLAEAVYRCLDDESLSGCRVMVTAGPTREQIDPVRFLSNPSTGRMGYALARVAARKGADVTVVAGPTEVSPPPLVETVRIESAEQMKKAVLDRADQMDFICKAAAVCDWKPATSRPHKTPKDKMASSLDLERTPDILMELGRRFSDRDGAPFLIGFAAQTDNLVERARDKLTRKHLDLIVANEVGGQDSSFGDTEPLLTLVADSFSKTIGPAHKVALAEQVWDVATSRRSG